MTEVDQPWTPAELEQLERTEQRQQRQQHAQRQAERYDRLARYSLDEENQQRYQAQAKKWAESSGINPYIKQAQIIQQRMQSQYGNDLTMSIDNLAGRAKSDIIVTGKQFGKKIGKHAQDYGLNPGLESDRDKMKRIIADIVDHCDEIRSGDWRGQMGISDFYIKGEDVVVVNNGQFVTILKGGVSNARIKNARKREV